MFDLEVLAYGAALRSQVFGPKKAQFPVKDTLADINVAEAYTQRKQSLVLGYNHVVQGGQCFM